MFPAALSWFTHFLQDPPLPSFPYQIQDFLALSILKCIDYCFWYLMIVLFSTLPITFSSILVRLYLIIYLLHCNFLIFSHRDQHFQHYYLSCISSDDITCNWLFITKSNCFMCLNSQTGKSWTNTAVIQSCSVFSLWNQSIKRAATSSYFCSNWSFCHLSLIMTNVHYR